jgi:hypothetical protein
MLKTILLSLALLAPIAAVADPLVSEGKAPSPAELAAKCAKGCVVLDDADQAALIGRVEEFAQSAFMAGAMQGHAAGVEEGLEAAKKNPKLCPKNI